MSLIVVVRWMFREWGRSATALALSLVALVLGPICLLASPLGISSSRESDGSYLGSISYLSSFFGAMTGLHLLSKAGVLWGELGAFPQAFVSGGVLSIATVVFSALAVVPILGYETGIEWSWGTGVFCALHWAAIACLLQRTPLELAGKCICLALLGWWIPAVLPDTGDWERVRWVLGPGRHFEAALDAGATSLGVLADTIPLVAWWVAAALLPTQDALRR